MSFDYGDRYDEAHIELPLNSEDKAKVPSGIFYKLICHKVSVCLKSTNVSRKFASGAQVHDVLEHQKRDFKDEKPFCPISSCMIIISIIQIITYLWDVFSSEDSQRDIQNADGPAARIFIYDPEKQIQVWRYVTYMLVHISFGHITGIIVFQVFLCLPLEMIHCWRRVLIIYFAGILAGSLVTSLYTPEVFLAGASGGIIALSTAHMSSIVMKRSEMRYSSLQLVIFVVLTAGYILKATYNHFIIHLEDEIAYAADFSGALAGLILGVIFFRDLEVKRWETLIYKVSFMICWLYCPLLF